LLQVLRRPEVTLSVQYPPLLAPVLGDLTQLSQVLLNLGTMRSRRSARDAVWWKS
jgi:nitrogen-specific signal transduction histidine kinase